MDIVSYSMDIIGYEDYLIYEDGRVFSKKSNRFLKPYNTKKGYLHIDLHKNNKRKIHKIHRLVGLHYIPNPDNKPQIDHKDRNKLNNDISNLRWMTNKENCNNKGMKITNQSGYTNIHYCPRYNKWIYSHNRKYKYFKSKIDAICYKFIMILRHKVKFT
tara:strand:+ start:6717 stop:7193 length:477 start_codon:yes stop_codon:yes gene_type:complete